MRSAVDFADVNVGVQQALVIGTDLNILPLAGSAAEIYILERLEAVESAVAYFSDGAGNGYLLKCGAAVECGLAYLGNSVGNNDAFQRLAVVKGLVGNFRQPVRKFNVLEAAAAEEGGAADTLNRVGDGNAFQLEAVLEGFAAYVGDAVLNNDGFYLVGIFVSWRNGFVIIGHFAFSVNGESALLVQRPAE